MPRKLKNRDNLDLINHRAKKLFDYSDNELISFLTIVEDFVERVNFKSMGNKKRYSYLESINYIRAYYDFLEPGIISKYFENAINKMVFNVNPEIKTQKNYENYIYESEFCPIDRVDLGSFINENKTPKEEKSNNIKKDKNNIEYDSIKYMRISDENNNYVYEGNRKISVQEVIERNPRISKIVKSENMRRNRGVILCEACGFENADPSVFDAHHIHPIAAGLRKTRIEDLAVLCPTCHRLAHRKGINPFSPVPVNDIKKYR